MSTLAEVAERGRLGIPPRALAEWRALAQAIAVYGPACCEDMPRELENVWWPRPADDASDAVRVCRACAVQPECLTYALAAGEREGVWGGTTPAERRP